MKFLSVALMQLLPLGSQEESLNKGIDYYKKAKQMGADIALFPEMWSNGYSLTADRAETEKNAICLDSKYINRFRQLAVEQNMAIGTTFLEKYDPSPRNSLVIIDRRGNIILHYAKVHTCVFDPTERQMTGDDDFWNKRSVPLFLFLNRRWNR